ncbi:hypothetical protein EAI30_08105 [Romboutsia ilealis]|uniref:UPF0145 protein H8923_09125 n=1 Tax=Romboutsia faecis TaxID=2764597 RepID=A0ABR7JQ66_9FIRM|nr:heavy metal-binding domain-containing protein [Romboutsia faecis]MBC5996922.1 heavy metal-binding domain-containing protein [Romboutsia faecis]MRN24576.1 hypothetical protein [Romboutsia ilealis]
MLIVTTDAIPGKNIIEVIGYVASGTVRSKNLGKDIGAGLKSLAGGELHSYTEMQNESRQIAIGRLVEQAEALNANAIVGLRLMSSSIMNSASEMVAYGTAVKIEE